MKELSEIFNYAREREQWHKMPILLAMWRAYYIHQNNEVMTTTTEKKRTTRSKYNARFHQLLTLNKCDRDEKKMIVKQCTNNRSVSAKYMTEKEFLIGIALLEGDRKKVINKMQAKAINTAKRLEIIKEVNGKMDWRGLNTFCDHTFKGKKFYELTYDELRHCITGLEKWYDGKMTKAVREL
jgi:hypothetical protein